MNKLLSWLVVIGGLVAVILLALAQYNDAKAERFYARAAVVQAQGQARLDTLAGIAGIIGAGFPHVVTIALVVLVVCIVVLFVIWIKELADSRAYRLALMRQSQPAERVIERIETRTILMIPPPNLSRRQFFRMVSQAEEIHRLGSGGD